MLSLSQVCTTLLQAIFSFRRGLARGIRVTKRRSLTGLFFLGSRNDKKVSEREQQHLMDLETKRSSPKSKTLASSLCEDRKNWSTAHSADLLADSPSVFLLLIRGTSRLPLTKY